MVDDGTVIVSGPVSTRLHHRLRDDTLLDKIGLLHDIDVETRTDVPCDVAMQWPDPWVVSVVLDDYVGGSGARRRLNDLHVATLRIAYMSDGAIPRPDALGENVEVMSM